LPLLFACCHAWSQSSAQTPEIVVTGGVDAIAFGGISSSDTASLLSGADVAQAGGVSGLPMIAITNLLDRLYASPLGGTWQSALYPPGFTGTTLRPLPGEGRSFDTGFSVKF
jgi:hypothetical protein